MSTVLTLYIANLKEFVRDRGALFWTLAFPLVFILLFGVIFSGNNNSVNYTVGLVNEDGGQAGAALVQAFHSVPALKVKDGARTDEMSTLKKGQRDFVVVIPAGLSQEVAAKQPATVEMYYDPSTNASDAQIKQTIVNDILAGFNQRATGVTPPLSLQTHTIVSAQLRAVDFLVPGILAMALMQLGLFGTAQPLVSLRQEQVLRRLGATPLPRWQLLAGQVLLRLTIALFQTALILLLAVNVFSVHVQGNMLAVFGLVLLGAGMFIGLGYFVASVSPTVESAGGIASAVNFPMMFLSGIFFPLALLPLFLTPVVRALPLTYLADALRQVMIGSTPEFPMTIDLVVVVAWLVVCSLLAVRFFRWE